MRHLQHRVEVSPVLTAIVPVTSASYHSLLIIVEIWAPPAICARLNLVCPSRASLEISGGIENKPLWNSPKMKHI